MAVSMLGFLGQLLPDALDRIVLPVEIRRLLEHLSTDLSPPAGPAAVPLSGDVQAAGDDSAGGFAELTIDPLGPAIPFDLRLTGPAATPTGFQLDLKPADGLLKLPAACVPAAIQVDASGRRAIVAAPAGGRVALTLNGADPLAIRIEGSVERPARQGIVAVDAAARGVLTVGTAPAAFLLGGQGFGLHLPGGLTVDSSPTDAPAPVSGGVGGPARSAAPGWEGVAIRAAELFLPAQTPLVGSGPIPVEFDLGMPGGLYGRTEAHVPADGSRPAFDVTLVWDDPGATSLASALPATVEIRTTWNLDEAAGPPGVGTIELLGGRPLRVTGRFARRPGTSEFDFGLVVEAGGDQGLLCVRGQDPAGRVVVTAAALATAFIADAAPPTPQQSEYDGFGATLHMLLVAAAGLSAFLDDGTVVLHAVEVDAGLGSAGTRVALRVDYSVDVVVRPIDLGFMSIGMKPSVPMRLRYRNVRLLVDFAQSGLDRFHLSFGEADVDVEDPGGWQVQSPGTLKDLFDVLGSRSGHGSQWFEIDLRFAVDLGPVRVSGATVRVTLGRNGALRPEVRGLDAALNMPGLFTASGKATLGPDRLDVALAATVVPLDVGAFASLTYSDLGNGVTALIFSLGADLAGPIPFANSGLGLYGLGGVFGVNAALPVPGPGKDPVLFQLELDPFDTEAYIGAPGGSVFGLGVVVGTAPDLGFTFSAKGVVVIGLPDTAVRASLQGRVLYPRVKTDDDLGPPAAGGGFVGVLTVAKDGVTIAARGHYEVPVLFTVDVPFGAHFPTAETDHPERWYVRLGSDGWHDRGPGPIQAKVLPGILTANAWAFFMVEGAGIPELGGPHSTLSPNGFSLGFGAGFTAVYGIPLIHVDVSASVILALGTHPLLLAGTGHLSGSLHLGPVSIGASAAIDFLIAPDLGEPWVRFQVCGEVDLFFFSLEGCVTIRIGNPSEAIPDPDDWPLESVVLADHRYTRLADAVRAPTQPPLEKLPVVWPDVIPLLQFTHGPANGLLPGPFTEKIDWTAVPVGSGIIGNERLSYTYTLTSITLTAIDPATGAATPEAGPLEAAWQEPVTGAPGEPGARELALLTWESALWIRKLADGAVNAPHDPVPGIVRRCHERFVAEPGWALGSLADRPGPGRPWRLPTEPAPGPYASGFDVHVTAEWWGIPVDNSATGFFPVTFPLRLGAPTAFDAPLRGIGRAFTGGFTLPHVVGLPLDLEPHESAPGIAELPVRVVLTFSEPLLDPHLGLSLPRWPPDYADRRMEVSLIGPGGSVPLPVLGDEPVSDDAFVRGYGIAGGPYTAIALEYHAALAPRVLGVRGICGRARDAADTATAATNKAGQAVAAKAPTVTPRRMLRPNTVYRIDVGLSGQSRRDGKNGDVHTHTDSYWLRTPDMSGPALSNGVQYLQGTGVAAALEHYETYVAAPAVLRKVDNFDPAYLERYVLSWTPADRTGHWFRDDPVGVQLDVNHVPDLAAVYDHDTLVRVRRTDPTKGEPDPFEEQTFPATNIWQAAVSALLPKADLRFHEATSAAGACPYPSPGATLGGRPTLRPLSDYELSLAFPFLDSAGSGRSGGAAIRGGIFGTSRYASPRDLLADLGFVTRHAGGGGVAGDLRVDRIPVTAGDTTADGAVERALTRLGLGRLPHARLARATALWTDDGGVWVLHGVLLEAPEPIHRADTLGLADFGGRLRVDGLSCDGQVFEGMIRSTSGDRLLFLTDFPLVPAAPLLLALTLQDIPLEAATVPVTTALECPVSPTPGFAEDLP
ncbi:hypothetical protein [Frankia sp. QA3]|uniref:hypothetical protein n=1 Tax=Frankia sp. QA3 TaxID=710111 RepID=UPI000269BC7B|nr:hypothetical protein [Frankia sp. QA3]EIV92689.1 hypothetical protein FraQA3DRAFT_2298 [Frankia sp. QA3]